MTQPPGAPTADRRQAFRRHWTWWLMMAVLLLVAGIRFRLLTIPLERDEGEYAYAGQLMLQGIPPYELAYNMKFPGVYAAYALILAGFGQTPGGIHLGVLVMTTLTALMLFWLGKKMLDETTGMVAASAYAFLAASPSMLGLAGHATHFAAFFVTAGLCALWRARQTGGWLAASVSGLLFGTAILMKQHAAIIAAWAGISFAATCLGKTEWPMGRRLPAVLVYALGMFLPLGGCGLLLWHAGVFGKFWFWTVAYASQYASVTPLASACNRFYNVLPLITSTTLLLWLLATAGAVRLWLDERLRSTRLWLAGFSVASALTVIPGFYFRSHYFLLTLPAAALLAGVAVSGIIRTQEKAGQPKARNLFMMVYALFLAATVFVNSHIWFAVNPGQAARELYGRDPFPEAQAIADFIRTHSADTAQVAVIGSEPEIYFLAHRHSATGYIYTYALVENQPFARMMQDEMVRQIESNAPQFIVYTAGALSWGSKPNPNTKILEWWKAYQTNYAPVAPADIFGPTNAFNDTSTKAIGTSNPTYFNAPAIFQRKSGAANLVNQGDQTQ